MGCSNSKATETATTFDKKVSPFHCPVWFKLELDLKFHSLKNVNSKV